MNLFFEKGYFNGVPIFPGQGEHFPLNTAWICYFLLMDRATATHTYGVFQAMRGSNFDVFFVFFEIYLR